MNKDLEVLEILDKLEECAYAMKDLPMSNWIDLAENEVELDLKIMNWVETIKFELFKGKQALLELKAIKEVKPSEALKCVGVLKEDDCITTLVQGKALETIRQYILKAQEQEKKLKALEIIKNKRVDTFYLTYCFNCGGLERYNRHATKHHIGTLKKGEFDLLKGILNDEQ